MSRAAWPEWLSVSENRTQSNHGDRGRDEEEKKWAGTWGRGGGKGKRLHCSGECVGRDVGVSLWSLVLLNHWSTWNHQPRTGRDAGSFLFRMRNSFKIHPIMALINSCIPLIFCVCVELMMFRRIADESSIAIRDRYYYRRPWASFFPTLQFEKLKEFDRKKREKLLLLLQILRLFFSFFFFASKPAFSQPALLSMFGSAARSDHVGHGHALRCVSSEDLRCRVCPENVSIHPAALIGCFQPWNVLSRCFDWQLLWEVVPVVLSPPAVSAGWPQGPAHRPRIIAFNIAEDKFKTDPGSKSLVVLWFSHKSSISDPGACFLSHWVIVPCTSML